MQRVLGTGRFPVEAGRSATVILLRAADHEDLGDRASDRFLRVEAGDPLHRRVPGEHRACRGEHEDPVRAAPHHVREVASLFEGLIEQLLVLVPGRDLRRERVHHRLLRCGECDGSVGRQHSDDPGLIDDRREVRGKTRPLADVGRRVPVSRGVGDGEVQAGFRAVQVQLIRLAEDQLGPSCIEDTTDELQERPEVEGTVEGTEQGASRLVQHAHAVALAALLLLTLVLEPSLVGEEGQHDRGDQEWEPHHTCTPHERGEQADREVPRRVEEVQAAREEENLADRSPRPAR